jgi:hypothetical protein
VNGAPQDAGGRLANTSVIAEEVYKQEYNGRNTILNRVYNNNGNYQPAAAVWDLSAPETAFNAAADASKNNTY